MKRKLFYFGIKGNFYPENTILHAATLIDSLFGFCTLGLIQPAFSEHVALIHLRKQIDKHRAKRKLRRIVEETVFFSEAEENKWFSLRNRCKHIQPCSKPDGLLCYNPIRLREPIGFNYCEYKHCPGITVKGKV